MEVCSELQAPAVSPGKNPGTHSVGGWVGPKRGLEGLGEEKNFLLRSGFESWTVHPVATLTTISWLLE
jgi:hypothetical protein